MFARTSAVYQSFVDRPYTRNVTIERKRVELARNRRNDKHERTYNNEFSFSIEAERRSR